MRWRDQGANVLERENSLCRDTVGSEKVVDRSAQELAIDEKVKGYGCLGREESVDECRKLVSAEVCTSQKIQDLLEKRLACRDENWTRVFW